MTRPIRRIWIYLFWGILWALIPKSLIVPLVYFALKPLWKHEIPRGPFLFLFCIGLVSISAFYVGAISFTPAGTFEDPQHVKTLLFLTVITEVILVVSTLRMVQSAPDWKTYLPFSSFRWTLKLVVTMLFSGTPLLLLLIPKQYMDGVEAEVGHPLVSSLVLVYKDGDLLSYAFGFISLALLGPLFEEMIFRGMMLQKSWQLSSSKFLRWSLYFFVSCLFAVVHYPVSLLFPFALSLLLIWVRNRTSSLWPCLFFHVAWNSSLAISCTYLFS